jgi:hypothetical protein
MKRFAFISRHIPTTAQVVLAQAQEIELVHVGDPDPFCINPTWVDERGKFEGVIVVHPAAAMNLCGFFLIGVFENSNRAPVGEKPTFEATALHVYDVHMFGRRT